MRKMRCVGPVGLNPDPDRAPELAAPENCVPRPEGERVAEEDPLDGDHALGHEGEHEGVHDLRRNMARFIFFLKKSR